MIRNKVQLIGNIGRDPEQVARTKDERPVVRFAIAQDVNGMDAATQKLVKKDSQWFQVSCFAGVAERVLASLKKGDLVIVSGELKSRTYQAENGQKRNAVEVVAQEVFRLECLRKSSNQVTEKEVLNLDDEVDFEFFKSIGGSL